METDQAPEAKSTATKQPEHAGAERSALPGWTRDLTGFWNVVTGSGAPSPVGLTALSASVLLLLVSLVCYRLEVGFAVTAFVYFVIVALHSIVGGFTASVLLSIGASACLDYFFLPPVFSFRVNAPLDALALATFVLTSIVINSLSYRLKKEALTASAQRDQIGRLYEAAQQLLVQESPRNGNETALAVFMDVFQLEGLCLYDAVSGEFHEAGRSEMGTRERTKEACLTGLASNDPMTGNCYHCLRSSSGIVGAIGYLGLRDAGLIAGPLTALAALTLERTRASRTASQAAAVAETEALRATVLDALAHEFKTPLSTILTAAGGMREFGPLAPTQMDFVQIVEAEANRLGMLTTRLLRTAKLEGNELVPKLSPVDLEALALSVAKRYSKLSPERRFSTVTYGDVRGIAADPELLRLALGQLLDNAIKYSTPHSAIEIEVERRGDRVSINVWNSGRAIPEAESELVFERFYRGAEGAEGISGTGLGLHVVRRIALAHGGDVIYEAVGGTKPALVFRLQLPIRGGDDESGKRKNERVQSADPHFGLG